MLQTIRRCLFLEAAAFTIASLIHFGRLIPGYGHSKAGTAEGVTAIVAFLVWGLAVMVRGGGNS